VITAGQLRAARALLGMDQRTLAERAGLSVATIQRMERSVGVVRGTVDSLVKLVAALNEAGLELMGEGSPSHGRGRGVRLRDGGESEGSTQPSDAHEPTDPWAGRRTTGQDA
jgi:transcriptional regulator with XRE-family HTH domain